ncbi:MAG TPA: hypothetical protein VNL18_02005 [Gemmatimonadales bacterium]|nr:hypothetical protein [Gemmatimonadales bacterium]
MRLRLVVDHCLAELGISHAKGEDTAPFEGEPDTTLMSHAALPIWSRCSGLRTPGTAAAIAT